MSRCREKEKLDFATLASCRQPRLRNLAASRPVIAISVPLILEYEEVADRLAPDLGVSPSDVSDILDYLCTVAIRRTVFFLWRPTLPDPSDDMILELAVDAGATVIVTFNIRDFAGAEAVRIRAVTPREYLRQIGALP